MRQANVLQCIPEGIRTSDTQGGEGPGTFAEPGEYFGLLWTADVLPDV